MIRKSGRLFSEKIMPNHKFWSAMAIHHIALQVQTGA
jgi:hypothetical protein